MPTIGSGYTSRQLYESLNNKDYKITKRQVEKDLIEMEAVFPIDCNKAGIPYTTRLSYSEYGFILPILDWRCMGAEELEQVFTPFYTTNRTGGGTGLGLSITYTIITNLGGRIWCESTSGKGYLYY